MHIGDLWVGLQDKVYDGRIGRTIMLFGQQDKVEPFSAMTTVAVSFFSTLPSWSGGLFTVSVRGARSEVHRAKSPRSTRQGSNQPEFHAKALSAGLLGSGNFG